MNESERIRAEMRRRDQLCEWALVGVLCIAAIVYVFMHT